MGDISNLFEVSHWKRICKIVFCYIEDPSLQLA